MKRGSIFEILFISIILLVMVMANFISYDIIQQVDNSTPDDMMNKTILNLGQEGIVNYGRSTPIVALVFAAGAIMLAAMLRSNPILLVLSIFLWIIVLLILGQLSNTFLLFVEYMSQEAQDALTAPTLIASNLPIYGVAVGMLILIVMHSTFSRGGSQGALI